MYYFLSCCKIVSHNQHDHWLANYFFLHRHSSSNRRQSPSSTTRAIWTHEKAARTKTTRTTRGNAAQTTSGKWQHRYKTSGRMHRNLFPEMTPSFPRNLVIMQLQNTYKSMGCWLYPHSLIHVIEALHEFIDCLQKKCLNQCILP